MASYGLRIINDESELLIDSEYFSPAFAQKLEFSPTVYSEEAGSTYFHSGYVKREYRTSTVTASGNFIVMWTLPSTTADVWYNFETSTTSMGGYLTLWVYANSMGGNLTYTLPTGYLFAISNLPASSETYGLRLFNAAGTKTFDSNNVQLAPYSISDSFTFFDDPTGPQGLSTSITLDIPTNPIFMLPNYTSLRIFKKMSGQVQTGHLEFVYEAMFRRQGNIVQVKDVQVYYSDEADIPWPYTQTIYNSGNRQGLGIIVANADLYAAPGTGTGTGTNPTYQLTSTSTSTSEGTSVTVTLTTQNVANNTPFAYTVTGVAAADLSVGGVTGSFIILNNLATANFTFANDYLTEGTEVFKLSLDGMSQFINITVADTSLTPSYSWSTPGNVNEGATGYTTFNATNANGKVVYFEVIAPSAGTSISGSSDGTLNTNSWAVSGNAATSINVQYSAVADLTTEGPEAFRINALVDSIVVATSADIIVNDTSKTAGYSIAAADSWNESNTFAVTISANNVNGTTLYLTTDNALVTPSSSTVLVNSDSFTTNINYTAGIVTTNTTVNLYVRTGSATGTIQATKSITLVNVTSSYSFGTVAAFNEGSSGSVQFNYSYAANTNITFEVTTPSSGASGVSDITLNTTSFSIGATNASGNTSVTYSAAADSLTEGPEYFRINAKIGASVIATSGDITINDTSLTPATYSLTRSVASVNEGGSFTVTFATNQSGSFAYTITGVSSADINSASLTGTVTNGTVLTYNVTADNTTEGTETFSIALNNGFASTSVTINDTSVTPSYSLTSSVASVNEGGSFTVTFATNQSGSFAYTITGVSSADISGASLTGTVSNGTVLTYTATADLLTEGTETFNIALNNGQASTSVTFNDTSLTPPTYSLTRSVASVNEGGSFTVTFATNQSGSFAYTITGVSSADISSASLTGTVTNGTVLTYSVSADSTTEGTETFNIALNNGLASTSVTINDTSLTPATYSLTRSVASVNEGGSFTVTFATNQSGSFTYTITGVSSADIGNASLTGTITNGTVLTYTATADLTTEGTETFSIALNNGFASTTVTINDTSLTPPAYSLGNTWTVLANGFSGTFYLNSTNANGVAVTVSASGPGASRVTINPSSFTIASNASTNTYVGVTASFPTATVAQQSVTISLSTGQSFLFDIPAYTVAGPAPTITSVTMVSGQYFPGETVDAIINFSGPITSDTYVNTKLTAGAYGSFYITSTTGAAVSPGANGTGGEYIDLTIGASSAYYTGPANPGQLNVLNATLSARTMTGTATGVQRQAYVVSSTFKVST
jgi:hypothetical protein